MSQDCRLTCPGHNLISDVEFPIFAARDSLRVMKATITTNNYALRQIVSSSQSDIHHQRWISRHIMRPHDKNMVIVTITRSLARGAGRRSRVSDPLADSGQAPRFIRDDKNSFQWVHHYGKVTPLSRRAGVGPGVRACVAAGAEPVIQPGDRFLGPPGPPRHLRNEAVQTSGWKLERAPRFGTLIRRHQELHHVDPVIEGEPG